MEEIIDHDTCSIVTIDNIVAVPIENNSWNRISETRYHTSYLPPIDAASNSQLLGKEENIYLCDDSTLNFTINNSESPKSVLQQTKPIGLNRTFICNICGSKLANSSNLKSHLRIHSGLKPYICEICGASFSQNSNLKSHRRIHTKEKPFTCHECYQKFSRSSHLTAHLRTHSGEKPYQCGVCAETFVTSTHLRNHMKKHTEEKPFCCDSCGATFLQNYYLQIHLRIHTGERPYQCNFANCNTSFRAKSDLRCHMQLHSEDKPFVCQRCSRSFKVGQYLRKHSKKCGAPSTGKKRGRPKKKINQTVKGEYHESSN